MERIKQIEDDVNDLNRVVAYKEMKLQAEAARNYKLYKDRAYEPQAAARSRETPLREKEQVSTCKRR